MATKRQGKRGGRARSRKTSRKKQGLLQGRWTLIFVAVAAAGIIYFALPRNSVPPAPVLSLQMIEKFPHDTTAFTQGLLIEDGQLFESTGQNGASSLRRVDLASGEVEMIHRLDSIYFGEGLAALNGRLYQLTWKKRVGFVYDQETFAPVDTLVIPTREGWGLTEDGQHLILSDGSAFLRYLDPETFSVVRELEVKDAGIPVPRLNELEYIDGLIYANVWQNANIAVIDSEDGRVLGWLNLNWLNVMHSPIDGADVLNGIAYDPDLKRLYVTGKLWPLLYAFRMPAIERQG